MGKTKWKTGTLAEIFPEIKEHDEFIMEVGKFFESFSTLENSLFLVLLKYSKVPYDIGRAILSPLRVDDAIQKIKRVISIRKMKSKQSKEMQYLLSQVASINKFRNDMIHIGPTYRGISKNIREYVVSNKKVSPRKGEFKHFPINVDILQNVNHDLELILLIILCQLHHPLNKINDDFNRILLQGIRRENSVNKPHAWLYKYPEPKSLRQRTPARKKARIAPPPSLPS